MARKVHRETARLILGLIHVGNQPDEHRSMFGTDLVPESQWNVVNWRLI